MPNKNYTPKPRTYQRGEVGYRNRDHQTGLDPFDNYSEWGRSCGLFFQHLLRGKLRTRNSIAVTILLVLGGLLTAGAVGMILGTLNEPYLLDSLCGILYIGIFVFFMGGLGLLILWAGLTNAAQLSGFTRWWRRQFKQTKKAKKH